MNEPDTHSKNTASDSFSRWMTLLAWLFGLGICVWAFSGLLEKQNNPNQNVESSQLGNTTEVRLKQNKQGHYVATGFINNKKVTFLVDTGATSVSVPAHLASELGLKARGSGISRTANGNVEIRFTTIGSLKLGDITLNDLSATINPGIGDDEVLLGMSALRQLEFTQRGEWLILRTL